MYPTPLHLRWALDISARQVTQSLVIFFSHEMALRVTKTELSHFECLLCSSDLCLFCHLGCGASISLRLPFKL
jgi:hypothetical protein